MAKKKAKKAVKKARGRVNVPAADAAKKKAKKVKKSQKKAAKKATKKAAKKKAAKKKAPKKAAAKGFTQRKVANLRQYTGVVGGKRVKYTNATSKRAKAQIKRQHAKAVKEAKAYNRKRQKATSDSNPTGRLG